jgi:hypothetical protein
MIVFPFDIFPEEYRGVMEKLQVSESGIAIMKDRFRMSLHLEAKRLFRHIL